MKLLKKEYRPTNLTNIFFGKIKKMEKEKEGQYLNWMTEAPPKLAVAFSGCTTI